LQRCMSPVMAPTHPRGLRPEHGSSARHFRADFQSQARRRPQRRGSGDVCQRKLPCQSGTGVGWRAALQSARVTILPQHDRAADRARGRGTNSCRCRCPSWQWSRLVCWTRGAPFDTRPIQASLAGEAEARPDHSITGLHLTAPSDLLADYGVERIRVIGAQHRTKLRTPASLKLR
jgi:hypothetical protein